MVVLKHDSVNVPVRGLESVCHGWRLPACLLHHGSGPALLRGLYSVQGFLLN